MTDPTKNIVERLREYDRREIVATIKRMLPELRVERVLSVRPEETNP